VAIYMKYGDIPGDATQAGHEEWINVDHFNWNAEWTISNRAKVTNKTRDNKHPALHDVTIRKQIDAASKHLLDAVCRPKDTRGETCIIRFLIISALTEKDADPDRQRYLEYKFHNSLITHVSVEADSDKRPTETVIINFTAVEMCVWPLHRTNERLPPLRFDRFDKVVDQA
jgi:type VI secretion system secreted protein Hcp